MLLRLAVENFLSIKEMVVLSMRAGDGASARHARRVGGRRGVLRCAAISGANAAGKSNVLKALEVLRALVTRGSAPERPIGVTGFRLDPAWRDRPTRFEVEVVLSGARYAYDVELTREAVVRERLSRGEGDDERVLFAREPGGDGETGHRFEFGALGGDDERRRFVELVARATPAGQLFLAEAWHRDVTEFSALAAWFDAGVTVLRPDSKYAPVVSELETETGRRFLEDRLRAWGTGIDGIEIRQVRFPIVLPGAVRSLTPDLRRQLVGHVYGDEPVELTETSRGDAVVKELRLRHRGARSADSLEWGAESDGTRRLMHLLSVLLQIHEHPEAGPLVALDELERSLHPTLARRFVEEFLELCESAPDSAAQLIFTTHDPHLLDGGLLPPASIWFVEKDGAGASHLALAATPPPKRV